MAQEQARRPSDAGSSISKAESHTAQDYIQSQLQLEADAREALPYQFDTCTQPLGPLRQSLFSCLTCNPPPTTSITDYTPAGVCYSCSISCHGEHTLVELFAKRDFVCDCGTTRLPASAPCTLRTNEATGLKGSVTGATPRLGNKYNHNFAGRFCACGDTYDPTKERGTMFQCLGLGHVKEKGCGEDWWHPECLLGMPRKSHADHLAPEHSASGLSKTEETEAGTPKPVVEESNEPMESANAGDPTSGAMNEELPLPDGFPAEDDFDHLICYKCVEANPWIKQYAGSAGFLAPVYKTAHKDLADESSGTEPSTINSKRKAENDEQVSAVKRTRVEENETTVDSDSKSAVSESGAAESTPQQTITPKHSQLPSAPLEVFSLFLKEDFREHLCRCAECFPRLAKNPQLLEEEESYEPPMSESENGDGEGGGSVGTGSILERGEAALSTMDRMRAIEGVMAYNHLRDKVKTFLQPFAESGQAVGAEDVKAYFAKLRGDEEAMKLAASSADGRGDGTDNRKEQSGY